MLFAYQLVIILANSVVDPGHNDHAADPAAPQGPAPDVLLRESGSPDQAGSDQVSLPLYLYLLVNSQWPR